MPGLRRSRAAGAIAALAAAVLTSAVLTAGPARASESAWAAGPTIGPVQINPVGHPRLCWQAGGNGSGVTLERCDPAVAGQQWSLTSNGVVMNGNGYCLEAGPGGGAIGGPAGGAFTASVTVANAASAQAAYGVAVTFTLPPQLAASALRVTGPIPGPISGPISGASGWTCDARTLTCTGTLPSGASRRVAITGRLPAAARPGTSYTVRARAAVTGTSQRRGIPRTAAILLLAGGVLLYVARRRPRHAARSRARREPGRRPHSHSRPRGLRHSHGSR